VVLNREIQDAQVINIISDDRSGVQNAVEYLISEGHRNIALIEGKEGFKSTYERKEGYMKALINHNIPIHKDYIVEGKYDMESGYWSMKQLLNHTNVPTAVFCSNDDMAVGAIKAIVEEGLKVPEDISIIGFDDNVFSSFLSPALTTVKKPIEDISIMGTTKLLKLIAGENLEREMIYVPTELKIRETVKSCSFKCTR
jgi:LacI family transcriptional regulator